MSLAERYPAILKRIRDAAGERPVTLLAVSKGQPASAIRELYGLGHRDFGENYVQEMLAKAEELADLPELRWHFIGHLQSNKVRVLLPHAHSIHTVDSVKLAVEISKRWAALARPGRARVFLEVNLDGEASKAGFSPAEVAGAARGITAAHPSLELRGLMAIPEAAATPAAAGAKFRRLAELARECPTAGDLSMGMSADFEAAIAEGATHVRVGTALFGKRS